MLKSCESVDQLMEYYDPEVCFPSLQAAQANPYDPVIQPRHAQGTVTGVISDPYINTIHLDPLRPQQVLSFVYVTHHLGS